LETAEGVDSQPLLRQDKQVPEEISSITESKSITKEASNDDVKKEVQDQVNNDEEQVGEFGPASFACIQYK
jgi:hypothetical protein